MSKEKIKFHYVKNSHFKSFFATGSFGGLTPAGLVSMAFYTERPAIPQSMVHEIGPGGLGTEIREDREGKDGVVREVDCNLMFDLNTARNIRTWLDQQIKILEALTEDQKKKETK